MRWFSYNVSLRPGKILGRSVTEKVVEFDRRNLVYFPENMLVNTVVTIMNP